MKKKSQIELFKKSSLSYGGDLQTTRKGRLGPRPLSTKYTMHLTLRSTQAKGKMSFLKFKKDIQFIINKFATKNGIKVISAANVGNHLHLQIKLSNRQTYKSFIRAITSAIAMKVNGINRWSKAPEESTPNTEPVKFWDRRPFTRIVVGYKALLNLKDYIFLNQLEGMGYTRKSAKQIIQQTTWYSKPGAGLSAVTYSGAS